MENITVKTSWSDINLREFMEISELENDEALKSTVIAKKVKLLASISNATYDEILDLDRSSLSVLIEATDFLHSDPEININPTFKVDGIEYMMMPDLDQMTAGESISLEQVLLSAEDTKGAIIADLLPILVRPVVRTVDPEFSDKVVLKLEKFDTSKLASRRELFLEKLNVPFFMGILKSISNGETSFEKVIQSYLGAARSIPQKGKVKKK